MSEEEFDAMRDAGLAPPRTWGFMDDEGRTTALLELVEKHMGAGKPLQPWAVRECRRLRVPTPPALLAA